MLIVKPAGAAKFTLPKRRVSLQWKGMEPHGATVFPCVAL